MKRILQFYCTFYLSLFKISGYCSQSTYDSNRELKGFANLSKVQQGFAYWFNDSLTRQWQGFKAGLTCSKRVYQCSNKGLLRV